MNYFLLLILVSVGLGELFLVNSNTTKGRYQHIYFPMEEAYWKPGNLFNVHLVHAPKTYKSNIAKTIDLCGDTRKLIMTAQPEIWNTTAIMNPCHQYFCNSVTPKWYPDNGTYVKLDKITNMMNNTDVIHTMILQYCTKCEDSVDEKFDLVMNDVSLNSTCKFVGRDICAGACPDGIQCFTLNSLVPMCYTPDNIFSGKMDFFYYYCVRLTLYGLPYLYFCVNLILFFVNVFCVFIPEINYLRKVYRSTASPWGKVKATFHLRNQTILIEVIANVAYVVTSAIDIANFTMQTFSSYILFLHFAGLIYSWSLLVILWTEIYNQTQDLDLDHKISPRLVISWVSVSVIGTSYAVFGIIAYVLWLEFPHLLGIRILLLIVVVLIGFALFVVSVFLTISSIRLLCVIEQPEDAASFGFYFFKLKLTRCIVVFNIVLAPSIFIIIMNGVQLIWSDIFSIYFNIAIIAPGTTIMALSFAALTCFTLIHTEKLRDCYSVKSKF